MDNNEMFASEHKNLANLCQQKILIKNPSKKCNNNNNINNTNKNNLRLTNNIYNYNDNNNIMYNSKINNNLIINNSNNNNNNNKYLCDLCLCQICSCYCYSCCYTNNATESGFFKFLARFSGRRRSLQRILNRLTSTLVCILIVISLFSVSEACSARTTPKPRPPPTPTPRPNITFHTYKCPATYAEWYCLNDAKCFSVKIADEILYNCWCADGYMGPRCEFKEIDGSFLPTRPRVMMETASIASGATLALIFVLILCLILYNRWQQRQKLIRFAAEENSSNGAGGAMHGIDTVDGITPGSLQVKCEHYQQIRRPFGPHHDRKISMEAAFKKYKENDV